MTPNLKVVLALLAMNSLPAALLVVSVVRPGGLGAAMVQAAGSTEAPPPGPTVPMETIIVGLSAAADDPDEHSLSIELDLELLGERDRSAVLEAMPRVRDSIISFLSDRTAEDLRGATRIGLVKSALVLRTNEALRARHVAGVFVKNLLLN